MDLEKIRNNRGKMIFKFSVPAIIAMVLTSLITIADGFFTGRYVGKEGIAAINLGLPIVYLYLGLGLMLSVGGSSLAGMALGEGDKEKCNKIFNQTMFTTVLVTFGVSLLAWVSFRPILSILKVDDQVAHYFLGYYMIMLVELPVLVINNAFGMFIRGEGNPQFFMKISILNVVGNIILDDLFAGKLHMGIEGIALASLLSSCLCLLCILYYFIRKSSVFKFKRFQFVREVAIRTVMIGFSEFIGEISMSITMFLYNLVIMRNIGVDGVTAFTIVGYISYVFSMILIGFGQGICPLVSFTYGAGDKNLAKSIRKSTNGYVFVAGVIVFCVMFFLSGWYSGIFVKSEAVKEMVQSGITIFTLSFLFSGINTITCFYFTSIGRAKESATISVMRGLIVLLICIAFFPVLFGMTGVWMVAPVTEMITMPVCIYFIWKNDRMIWANSNISIENRPNATTR
ncbi:MATE family efflux transporter [Anaeromicropila herbilytica]|uniref:MATE family efflux transporter n=1 Tax=Anaeromicropila herbilytica TaxID=2785025 RepID=A0A7R7EPJ9_9FIRM|nr:MATE family efflux transporter [Anaeromicropila herbilytica]BCN32715.1 MATE family efflux transporter [Anaeromicropila herbilytica]